MGFSAFKLQAQSLILSRGGVLFFMSTVKD